MMFLRGFSFILISSCSTADNRSNEILIHAEGLSKSFGSVIFKDISFQLRRGDTLGIIGGNGSGKTTLLNTIAGLDNQFIGKLHKNCKVGYVMQKAGLFPRLSCIDNMKYVCALNSIPKAVAAQHIKEYAELCGISDFLHKRAELCSGGMQQRLNIALALLPKPDLLLLDEATSGLDAKSRKTLHHLLDSFMSDGKHSLIMVSHYKQEISGICSVVLDMETGSMENV